MPASDSDLQAGLDALMGRINAACADATAKGALAMQAAGMAHTRVKSGSLRRSWRTQGLPPMPGVYSAEVGPTTVYARRIELGFYNMRDKLGRLYHQRPKPYVKPAYAETVPKVREYGVNAIAGAIRG